MQMSFACPHCSSELELEGEIKQEIGDGEVGVLPSGVSYSWRNQTRKGYTVEEKTFRAFRRKKA